MTVESITDYRVKHVDNELAPDTQEMLESLRTAVEEALERKRRLGQYAVIWQDGKPVLIGENEPQQHREQGGNGQQP